MSRQPLYPHVPKSRTKGRLEALREILAAKTVEDVIILKGKYQDVKLTSDDVEAINKHIAHLGKTEQEPAADIGNPQTYAKVWNAIDKEKLRKYCEEVWGVPVTAEASDYLGRLLARRVDQFKSYLPLPLINQRELTARDMYWAASALFD